MAATKFFQVTYDKKIGGTGTMVVKAMSTNEALKNAENNCFTGRNFRDAVEVEKQDTFSMLHPNGRCGRLRAN